jgi:adenine/guanine phosphoribosyltransferase-like PRPP-binding protein
MTDEQLAEIKSRSERDDETWKTTGMKFQDVFQMMGDRKHLLAEVERLRALLEAARD